MLVDKKTPHSFSYTPLISIRFYEENSNTYFEINDNGIGMDDYVLNEYFFKIGNSYYSSIEFDKLKQINDIQNFSPISRFGIGLISVFMISDTIKVITSNKKSIYGDSTVKTLTIDGINTIAFVTEESNNFWGTTIDS